MSVDLLMSVKRQIAYSYIRFSKDLQAKGDSYRRQLEISRRYCEQRGLELDESLELKDLGVSGFKGRNVEKGALGRFLEACESGRVKKGSALVVESLDRLSRQSPRKAIGLLNQLLEFVDLHVTSLNKVFLANSPQDEGIDLILAVAMAMRANEESETKSKRLREAWSQKRKRAAEKGEFMRQDLPWWLIYEGRKIICPAERAAVVRTIYELTSRGYSSAQVARELNTRGLLTWRPSKLWTSARVRGLVRSHAPQGILVATKKTRDAGRDYELLGYYPAVVSENLAASARAVLQRNTRGSRGPAGTDTVNMFRGLLRFRGHWMRYASHRNGTRASTGVREKNWYYECFEEIPGGTGGGELLFGISGKRLESVIFTCLAELRPSDLHPPNRANDDTRLATVVGKLHTLEEKQTNLLAAVESGSTTVAQRLRLIELEIDQLRKERQQLETKSPILVIEKSDFKSIVGNLRDLDIRRRAAAELRRTVVRIDVGRVISDLPIDDRTLERFVRQQSSLPVRYLPDPENADKRRKPLHVLITFASGAVRYIARTAESNSRNVVASYRLEA